jgi:DNA-binding CsgD family transcriptional regulator/5-methylcytosine-specific restriction endonuclease McrA
MFVPSIARIQIAALHREGVSTPDIARQLGLALPTVAYHVRRLNLAPSESEPAAVVPAPPGHARTPTRDAVAELLRTGMTTAQIARELGLAKATVTYHAQRLNQTIDARCARRYDWAAIQAYYDEGHSVRECMAAFGFSSASWFEAVKRGAVQARPGAMAIDDLLKAGTYRGRDHLKARLISEGLKEHRCERCGLTQWQGQPITLALHHVNGVRDDNRLENLQILCPNCHSQTDTFAGRNGRARVTLLGERAPPADGSSAQEGVGG